MVVIVVPVEVLPLIDYTRYKPVSQHMKCLPADVVSYIYKFTDNFENNMNNVIKELENNWKLMTEIVYVYELHVKRFTRKHNLMFISDYLGKTKLPVMMRLLKSCGGVPRTKKRIIKSEIVKIIGNRIKAMETCHLNNLLTEKQFQTICDREWHYLLRV